MSDHHARPARDVYDHEHEEPRSGRRRRPVADWGVGEDMFEHMPRYRFSRAAEGPPRDRRFPRPSAADHRDRTAADRRERTDADHRSRDWADWDRNDDVVARD